MSPLADDFFCTDCVQIKCAGCTVQHLNRRRTAAAEASRVYDAAAAGTYMYMVVSTFVADYDVREQRFQQTNKLRM